MNVFYAGGFFKQCRRRLHDVFPQEDVRSSSGGAGGAGLAAAALMHSRAIPWIGFIDCDPAKTGLILTGKPVYLPEELHRRAGRPRILIASMYYQEIENQLKDYGFRPQHDFQIFPNDETGLSRLGGGIELYDLWRHLKLEREGYVLAGTNGSPRIRLIRIDEQDVPISGKSEIEKHLPRNGESWVCLHHSDCRAVKWYWHGIESKHPEAEVANVGVDFLPPVRKGLSPSYLLSLTATEPSLPDKIVACRTRLVREFLLEK